MSFRRLLKTRRFRQPTPSIEGVNLHPLDPGTGRIRFRGVRFQTSNPVTVPTRENSTRIIFEITVTRLDFSELISKNYPMPFEFMRVARHYPPRTPVLVELFFIAVTRFEVFRINWVMFGSAVSNTELSEVFRGSLSSRERTQ